MKLSYALAFVFASAVQARKSYRNRHLTTYSEVCFPSKAPTVASSLEPTAAIITVPSPTSGKGKGKGKGYVSGPTSKSPPVSYPTTSGKGGPSQSSPTGKGKGKGGSSTGSGSKSNTPPGSSPTSKSYSPPGPSPTSKSYSPPGPSPTSKSYYSLPGASSTSGKHSAPGPSTSKSSDPASGYIRLRQLAASSSFGSSSSTEKVSSETAKKSPLLLQQTVVVEDSSLDRMLDTIISLNTTFAKFGSYAALSAGFSGTAVLSWPNVCFSASIQLTNFVANCQGCSFVVTEGSHSCDPASISVVTPFTDPTEVPFNPYANSTSFNTDASGSATISVPVLCTGTGPQDNYNRPLLLVDATGQIAACGVLSYVCK